MFLFRAVSSVRRGSGATGVRHLTQLLQLVPERLEEEDALRELDAAAPKIHDVKPVSASHSRL